MFNKLFGNIVKKGQRYNRVHDTETMGYAEEAKMPSGLRSGAIQASVDSENLRRISEQYLELHNKFMALCDHLGVYIEMPRPQYQVRDNKQQDRPMNEVEARPMTTARAGQKVRSGR